MNILVIGNGFDIAHGLPTKYTDFLKFVKKVKEQEEWKPLAEENIWCIFRKNCASVPEERSAIPLQTEQSSAG